MPRPAAPVTFKNDTFYRGGRKISKGAKGYKTILVKHICGQIAQGKSLEKVLPIETTPSMPNIMDFMELVDSDVSLKQLYNKALSARYTLMSERLVAAVQRYEQDPSSENADVLKAIQAARVYLERGGVMDSNVTIQVTSVVPKGFWEQSDWAQERTKRARKNK